MFRTFTMTSHRGGVRCGNFAHLPVSSLSIGALYLNGGTVLRPVIADTNQILNDMDKNKQNYESPQMEITVIIPENGILTSSLEQPDIDPWN